MSTEQSPNIGWDKQSKGRNFNVIFFSDSSQRYVTFESAIKEPAAFAVKCVLTPILVWRILLFVSNRDDSKRPFAGSVESQQLYPTALDSYAHTGLSSSFSSCEDFTKNFQKKRGYIDLMASTTKLSIDKATVRQLCKVAV